MQDKTSNDSHKGRLVYIATYGCQMNDRDSEALTGLFLEQGYAVTEKVEEADVILVNTCSVRDHAENRAISLLGTFKKLFAKRSTLSANPVIGLIGCLARNKGREIFQKMPHVNLICGPAVVDKIVEYVEKIQKENIRIIDLEDRMRNEDFYRAAFRAESGHAQVVISTGCSNYCTYCVVPYVRGELRLRKPENIIDEVKRNVDLGIKKITFLGQNVNDYFYSPSSFVPRPSSFVDLLRMVVEVDGVQEVDFVTSHPKNTSVELFQLMAESPKIRKQLHLPFQSGSDRILKLMNRGYTKEEYLKLINDYKDITGGTLGTDVIVGFPTETEEDFLHTKDVLEKVKFNYAYIFKYSTRPGTKAALVEDDVPEEVKKKRHEILLKIQKDIVRVRNSEV